MQSLLHLHLLGLTITVLLLFHMITIGAAAGRTRRSPPSCYQICDYVESEGDAYCGQRHLTEVPRDCNESVLLDLRGNELHDLHPGVFTDFIRLKYLDLTSNQLEILRPRLFSGATQLLDVYIINNSLSIIGHDAFADTGNIETIYLSRNNIQTLPPSAFRGLGNLRVLYLSRNRITYVSRHLFKYSQNMTHLSLAYNQLEVVLMETFQHLTKLEYVDLSFNQIHTLPENPFLGLPSLRIVKAINNSLGSDFICTQLLESPQFETLELTGNRIQSIPMGLDDLMLVKLRLAQNPLVCNCSLQPLQNLYYSSLGNEEWVNQVTCSNGERVISAILECPTTANKLTSLPHSTLKMDTQDEEANSNETAYHGDDSVVVVAVVTIVVAIICFSICMYIIIMWVRSCRNEYGKKQKPPGLMVTEKNYEEHYREDCFIYTTTTDVNHGHRKTSHTDKCFTHV